MVSAELVFWSWVTSVIGTLVFAGVLVAGVHFCLSWVYQALDTKLGDTLGAEDAWLLHRDGQWWIWYRGEPEPRGPYASEGERDLSLEGLRYKT